MQNPSASDEGGPGQAKEPVAPVGGTSASTHTTSRADATGPSGPTTLSASTDGPATPVPPAPGEPANPSEAGPPASPPSRFTRPPPDRLRTNIKVAAVVMVLFGALTSWDAFEAHNRLTTQVTDDHIRSIAQGPGGNLTVQFAQASPTNPAHVQVSDFNGTTVSELNLTNEDPIRIEAQRYAVRVEVTWSNATWIRNLLVPPTYEIPLALDAASERTEPGWQKPDSGAMLSVVQVSLAAGLLIMLGGIFGFLLRARMVAQIGAYVFLVGGILLVVIAMGFMSAVGPLVLLQPALLAALGGFCVWAFRKGKDRFQPLQIGPVRL